MSSKQLPLIIAGAAAAAAAVAYFLRGASSSGGGVSEAERAKKLVLFDVDGTLTAARKQATPEVLQFLKDLRKRVTIGMVGGSDLKKQQEQLDPDVVHMFDYTFAEVSERASERASDRPLCALGAGVVPARCVAESERPPAARREIERPPAVRERNCALSRRANETAPSRGARTRRRRSSCGVPQIARSLSPRLACGDTADRLACFSIARPPVRARAPRTDAVCAGARGHASAQFVPARAVTQARGAVRRGRWTALHPRPSPPPLRVLPRRRPVVAPTLSDLSDDAVAPRPPRPLAPPPGGTASRGATGRPPPSRPPPRTGSRRTRTAS